MSKKARFGKDYQDYLDSLKRNVDPAQAAKEAGLAYEDIYQRRKDDQLFAEAEIIAEEEGSFVNERNIKALAAGGDQRAAVYMAKERAALRWRERASSNGPEVKDGDRQTAILTLVEQLNMREEAYGAEIEID
jgi:hypothetical protein